jgi:RNA polymerase sigma factor for flagellar operon FliA
MNARPVRYGIESAWQSWHDDREPMAREWLVVHYASLVKFVAGRLAAGLPRSVDTGDLVSAGVFGLMSAIDRFDPAHGAKFETFAIPRIRGAILDSLRALDWVPRSVRSRSRAVQDAIATLAAGSVGPLDHVAMDSAPSDSAHEHQPGHALEQEELRGAMRREIGRLPEREQAVLILYYEDGLTLAEIGDALGVTESRISQIHTKAVLQLRARLASAGMG